MTKVLHLPQKTWEPPEAQAVAAADQAVAIVAALQEEGLTGRIERREILYRYPEHCWMLGFEPVSENIFFKALGKIVKKIRVKDNGVRTTAYLIPEAGEVAKPTEKPLAVNRPKQVQFCDTHVNRTRAAQAEQAQKAWEAVIKRKRAA